MTNLEKLKELMNVIDASPDRIINEFDQFIKDDYWSKEYDKRNNIYSWVYIDKEYYYINTTGGIEIARHFDQDSRIDVDTLKKKIAIDNVFRYQTDAENEIERRKICARLKELADCKFDEDGCCWIIVYNSLLKNIGWTRFAGLITSEFWFSSKEACMKAIETIGAENLKMYYFRIEEEA